MREAPEGAHRASRATPEGVSRDRGNGSGLGTDPDMSDGQATMEKSRPRRPAAPKGRSGQGPTGRGGHGSYQHNSGWPRKRPPRDSRTRPSPDPISRRVGNRAANVLPTRTSHFRIQGLRERICDPEIYLEQSSARRQFEFVNTLASRLPVSIPQPFIFIPSGAFT